jgi:hypothetical protein
MPYILYLQQPFLILVLYSRVMMNGLGWRRRLVSRGGYTMGVFTPWKIVAWVYHRYVLLVWTISCKYCKLLSIN